MNYVLFNYPTTVYFPEAEYTEEELINRIHFLDRRFLAEIESNPNVPDILELYRLIQELGQDMLDRLREGIAAQAARDAEVEADEEAFYAALETPVIEISDDEEAPVVRIKQEYEQETHVPYVFQPLVPPVPVRIEDEEEDQYMHTVYRDENYIDIDNLDLNYDSEDMSDEDC